MNRDQVVRIVRETLTYSARGFSTDEIVEFIHDEILSFAPVMKMPVKKAPQATATSVSATLGRYRDDDDGKPLAKAVVRQTRFGPVQYGGYKVSRHSINTYPNQSVVEVRWIAPDDMNDEKAVAEERVAMLTWYGDILRRFGYTVRNFMDHSLHVTR